MNYVIRRAFTLISPKSTLRELLDWTNKNIFSVNTQPIYQDINPNVALRVKYLPDPGLSRFTVVQVCNVTVSELVDLPNDFVIVGDQKIT